MEIPPCFDSPPNVHLSIVRSDNTLLEDDEMKLVISSTCEELRGLLSITPTNLEQAYELKNLVGNARIKSTIKCFSIL